MDRPAGIPTVTLAKIEQGNAQQYLTLPGIIQPYYKASIYARVSGYLKSWQEDIGAQVKAGNCLHRSIRRISTSNSTRARRILPPPRRMKSWRPSTAKRWQALGASQAWRSRRWTKNSGRGGKESPR